MSGACISALQLLADNMFFSCVIAQLMLLSRVYKYYFHITINSSSGFIQFPFMCYTLLIFLMLFIRHVAHLNDDDASTV